MEVKKKWGLAALIVLDLLWIAFILLRSCKVKEASGRESMVFVDFLLRLFPKLTTADLDLVTKIIRKLAHFTEFFLLGVLLWWTCRAAWRSMLWQPFAGGALVACIDETVQRFVPGRSGQISDVALDCAGVLAAVLLLWWISRCRQRKRARKGSGIKDQGSGGR